MDPAALEAYGRICGWTLARAHARSGDRIAIAAYLGSGDAFDHAMASFAEAYADQNERDYRTLQRGGRVRPRPGRAGGLTPRPRMGAVAARALLRGCGSRRMGRIGRCTAVVEMRKSSASERAERDGGHSDGSGTRRCQASVQALSHGRRMRTVQ